jgi:hypothetical protein
LTEVQAGKRPLATMRGLASQPELTEMLKTNWSAEVVQMTAARTAAMRQAGVTARGGLSATTTLSPPSSFATATPLRKSSATIDYSPPIALITFPLPLPPQNFGSVWTGQSAFAYVFLTAPTDGNVVGRLNLNATNRRFRIVNAVTYTGEVVNGVPTVALTKPGGLYQDVFPDPQNPPDYISQAGILSIGVKKGQLVMFTVAFEPVFFGMAAVGNNETTLELTGQSQFVRWARTTSLRARFEGVNLGIMALSDQGHADTLTNRVVEMPIIITNAAASAWAGTLTAAQLPPGVTMDPLSVSFPGQGTQRHLARFHVSDAAQDGSAQSIVVRVDGAGQTRLVNLDMSIYHPWVTWCFGLECLPIGAPGSGDIPGIENCHNPYGYVGGRLGTGCDLGLDGAKLWIKDDGQWWWEFGAHNASGIDFGGSDFTVRVQFEANHTVSDKILVHIGPSTFGQMYGHQLADPWIRYNFLTAANAGVTFHYSEN